MTPALYDEIVRTVFRPTVEELGRRGVGFRGVLYAGIILTADGPQVLEFNCRFGDPETQALVPRLRSDLLALLWAAARGEALPAAAEWSEGPCVGVVMASRGYPATSSNGRRHRRVGRRRRPARRGGVPFGDGVGGWDYRHRRRPGAHGERGGRLVRGSSAPGIRGSRAHHVRRSPAPYGYRPAGGGE